MGIEMLWHDHFFTPIVHFNSGSSNLTLCLCQSYLQNHASCVNDSCIYTSIQCSNHEFQRFIGRHDNNLIPWTQKAGNIINCMTLQNNSESFTYYLKLIQKQMHKFQLSYNFWTLIFGNADTDKYLSRRNIAILNSDQ